MFHNEYRIVTSLKRDQNEQKGGHI